MSDFINKILKESLLKENNGSIISAVDKNNKTVYFTGLNSKNLWSYDKKNAEVFSTFASAHKILDNLGLKDLGVILTESSNINSENVIKEDLQIELIDLGLNMNDVKKLMNKFSNTIDIIIKTLSNKILQDERYYLKIHNYAISLIQKFNSK